MLTATYGDKAQDVADAFAAAYPDKPLVEALYINAMPPAGGAKGISRLAFINEYGKQFNAAGATVYNYVTAYDAPYFGGVTMHHTGDIPYWFASIDTIEYQIKGDEAGAHKISDLMSDALYSFMVDGDPSTDSLEWTAYTDDSPATMVFTSDAELKVNFDRALYDIIAAE